MWIENYKMQGAAYSVAYYDRYGELPHGAEIWIANDVNDKPQVFQMNRRDIKEYFEKFIELVKGVKGVGEHIFTNLDIVRAKILIDIVARYDTWKAQNQKK